jgi:serine/threonine protein kinase
MTTTSRPDALAPGTLLGPYEIVALIGAGGMGAVYRARDPRLDRDVAVKVLLSAVATDPDRLARFEIEARAVGRLEHPNVLVVYDVGRHGAIPYLVTELLEGETLGGRLKAGSLPVRKAVEYAAQIARGLAAAHAKGIIHRDLKPDNLFITTDDRIKILDFGLAKLAVPLAEAPTAPTAPQTDAGIVLGTAGYMSPEQVRGETLDARTDIFSLGAVTHEMLGGTRPFARGTSVETMNAILKDDAPELPPAVHPGLDRIVRRCLEKRREDRFHSAHDLGLALEAQSMTGDRTSSIASLSSPRIWTRRRAIGLGASGLGLLALGAGATILVDRRAAPSPSYRRLTFRRGLIRSARFAPDAQTILYGALWDGEACRIHSVRGDSPESRPLDLAQANLLAVSSKGEIAMALGSHFEGIHTYGTLARVPLAGGAPREILEDVKFADWSPDGSELAIVRRVGGTIGSSTLSATCCWRHAQGSASCECRRTAHASRSSPVLSTAPYRSWIEQARRNRSQRITAISTAWPGTRMRFGTPPPMNVPSSDRFTR